MESIPKSALVSFDVFRFTHAECIWSDCSDDSYVEELIKTYAIGLPDSKCFKDSSFRGEAPILAMAERYGGYGGAGNGGGGRCANLGSKQVKGVGANLMVGDNVDEWYSNGALNIIDAVCEVIFSAVLNDTMPLGAAKCYGILSTGANTAFHTESLKQENIQPCIGALLIRDACLRPAHFLRAREYTVPKRHKKYLRSDVSRVRDSIQELANSFEDTSEFIRYMGRFAANMANQFSFALVARITHGAATPSNFSMDGRWLDLTTTSLLDGGKNYKISGDQAAFFDEHKVTLDIILEIMSTYAKYRGLTLDPGPILAYFEEAMTYYFHSNCSYLLGVPIEKFPALGECRYCDSLCKNLKRIIMWDTTVVPKSPHILAPTDPVLAFVTLLYNSSFQRETAIREINHLFNGEIGGEESVDHFLQLMKKMGAERDVRLSYLLKSLKRIYCSAYFFRGWIRSTLSSMLTSSSVDEFSSFTSRSIEISNWVFKDEPHKVVLFRSDSIELEFTTESGIFRLLRSGNTLLITNSYRCILESIRNSDTGLYTINGFNFLDYLISIEDTVCTYIK